MSRQQWAGDIGLAGAAVALSLGLSTGLPDLPVAAVALGVAHGASLAVRRRWPVAALVVAVGTAVAVGLGGYPLVLLGLAPLAVAYTVAAELPRRPALVALVVIEAGVLVALVPGDTDASTMLGDALALGAAWLFGDRSRRRLELVDAQRDRAVAEERLRIARELHDVVAHSMSVVAVQAASGRLVVEDDPARARQALLAIEQTSRSALDEMRRLLGVLRQDGDGNGRRPAPGLDELEALVAEAGMPVSMRVEGERRPLSAGVELTAYRIVQEGLTNVRKHAPGAAATVVVAYDPDRLRIEIVDDGAGRPPRPMGTTGHGLLGMRERVAVYGGTVDAGPRPAGGFRVMATLPERA